MILMFLTPHITHLFLARKTCLFDNVYGKMLCEVDFDGAKIDILF